MHRCAVAVALLGGCGTDGSVVGAWDLVDVEVIGPSSAEEITQGEMLVRDDLTGTVTVWFGESESALDFTGADEGSDGWLFTLADGETLACTLADDVLDCVLSLDSGEPNAGLTFERGGPGEPPWIGPEPTTTTGLFDPTGTWTGTCDGTVQVAETYGEIDDFPVHLEVEVALVKDGGALSGTVAYTAAFPHVNPPTTTPATSTTGTQTTTTTTGLRAGTWTVAGTMRGYALELDVVGAETTTTADVSVPIDAASLTLAAYGPNDLDALQGYLSQAPDVYGLQHTVPCAVAR